jgi:hypothetical protein
MEGYYVAKLMQRGAPLEHLGYAAFRVYIEEIDYKFGRRSKL